MNEPVAIQLPDGSYAPAAHVQGGVASPIVAVDGNADCCCEPSADCCAVANQCRHYSDFNAYTASLDPQNQFFQDVVSGVDHSQRLPGWSPLGLSFDVLHTTRVVFDRRNSNFGFVWQEYISLEYQVMRRYRLGPPPGASQQQLVDAFGPALGSQGWFPADMWVDEWAVSEDKGIYRGSLGVVGVPSCASWWVDEGMPSGNWEVRWLNGNNQDQQSGTISTYSDIRFFLTVKESAFPYDPTEPFGPGSYFNRWHNNRTGTVQSYEDVIGYDPWDSGDARFGFRTPIYWQAALDQNGFANNPTNPINGGCAWGPSKDPRVGVAIYTGGTTQTLDGSANVSVDIPWLYTFGSSSQPEIEEARAETEKLIRVGGQGSWQGSSGIFNPVTGEGVVDVVSSHGLLGSEWKYESDWSTSNDSFRPTYRLHRVTNVILDPVPCPGFSSLPDNPCPTDAQANLIAVECGGTEEIAVDPSTRPTSDHITCFLGEQRYLVTDTETQNEAVEVVWSTDPCDPPGTEYAIAFKCGDINDTVVYKINPDVGIGNGRVTRFSFEPNPQCPDQFAQNVGCGWIRYYQPTAQTVDGPATPNVSHVAGSPCPPDQLQSCVPCEDDPDDGEVIVPSTGPAGTTDPLTQQAIFRQARAAGCRNCGDPGVEDLV